MYKYVTLIGLRRSQGGLCMRIRFRSCWVATEKPRPLLFVPSFLRHRNRVASNFEICRLPSAALYLVNGILSTKLHSWPVMVPSCTRTRAHTRTPYSFADFSQRHFNTRLGQEKNKRPKNVPENWSPHFNSRLERREAKRPTQKLSSPWRIWQRYSHPWQLIN